MEHTSKKKEYNGPQCPDCVLLRINSYSYNLSGLYMNVYTMYISDAKIILIINFMEKLLY